MQLGCKDRKRNIFAQEFIWTGTETRDPGSAQHLQNYLGMIGLPMDMHPQFPTDRQQILLTEQAAKDNQVVEKIKLCTHYS